MHFNTSDFCNKLIASLRPVFHVLHVSRPQVPHLASPSANSMYTLPSVPVPMSHLFLHCEATRANRSRWILQ